MTRSHSLRTVFLGSGSAGNATAITDGTTTVLVDCGFSARETACRLATAGIEPSGVSAILLTHEHADHLRGVGVFVRRHAPGCVVHGTKGTLRASGLRGSGTDTVEVKTGSEVALGTLRIIAFATSHDAAEPVGYRVSHGSDSVGIATDTGKITPEALEALLGVRVLGLESNHDVTMLERGPYPSFLKQRILSSRGHLSNADAARALELLASDRLEHVFALHRSTTNNSRELAQSALTQKADELGIKATIEVACQVTPCSTP